MLFFFFYKHKTAYDMLISDWSSDVCSSDLDDDSTDASIRGLFDLPKRPLAQAGQIHNEIDGEGHKHVQAPEFHTAPVDARSEESRGGKECVSTCRSRRSQYQ